MKFDMVMKQVKLNMLILLLMRFMLSREINAVLLTATKKISVVMHLELDNDKWFASYLGQWYKLLSQV